MNIGQKALFKVKHWLQKIRIFRRSPRGLVILTFTIGGSMTFGGQSFAANFVSVSDTELVLTRYPDTGGKFQCIRGRLFYVKPDTEAFIAVAKVEKRGRLWWRTLYKWGKPHGRVQVKKGSLSTRQKQHLRRTRRSRR